MFSGPCPKPTAIKEAEGNPGKKKLPLNEPKPEKEASLEPPPSLTGKAREFWLQYAPEYVAAKLLFAVDVPKFAMYCRALADVERLTEEVDAEGEVISGFNKKGMPYSLPNPKCALRERAANRVDKLGMQFGDSPGARARIGSLRDDETDAIDEYLAEGDEE